MLRRSLHISLGLFGLLAPATATAGALTVLPNGPIHADGVTPQTIALACGECPDGAAVRIRERDVTLQRASVESGVVELQVVLPARDAPGTQPLSLRLTSSGGKISDAVAVPVRPPAARLLEVTPASSEVAPGGAPVMVRIPPPTDALEPSAARYLVRATIGSVGPIEVLPSGEARFQWTPPTAARAPRLALLTVVDARAPDQRIGWTTIGVRAQTSLSYEVPPDAEVVLVVGSERFGPRRASPAGSVAFDAALPPSEGEATLEITEKTGARTSRTVPLPLGAGATHDLLPTAARLPADPGLPASVLVVSVQRDGSPAGTAPNLRASRGDLGAPAATQWPGVFRSTWTAPAQTGTVEFTAEVDAERRAFQAQLVEGLPSVVLSTEPATLPADQPRFTLETVVSPPAGGLAPARAPRIEAEGARAVSRMRAAGGTYTLPLRLDPDAPGARLQALPAVPSGGAPLARLLTWADPPAAPGGPALITVVATDASGLPLAGTAVDLAVPTGSGSLPPSGTTDASGVLRLPYDLGQDDAPSLLVFSADGLTGRLSILPGNTPAPPSGAPAHLDLLARYQTVFPVLSVEQAAAPPAPIATATPRPPAPQPASDEAAAGPAVAPDDAAAERPTTPTATAKRKPRPARDRPAGSAAAWARTGLDLQGLGLTYAGTAEVGGVGPTALAFETGNLTSGDLFTGLGASARGLLFPGGGRVGADLMVGWMSLPAEPANTSSDRFADWFGQAGVRVRSPAQGPFGWHVVAQAERASALLLLFEGGDPTQLGAVVYSYTGLRAGLGGTVEAGDFYGELQVTETFAFAPVDLRAQLAAEYAVTDAWGVRLSGRYSLRSMAFEVVEEDVQIEDRLQSLSLGASYTFR